MAEEKKDGEDEAPLGSVPAEMMRGLFGAIIKVLEKLLDRGVLITALIVFPVSAVALVRLLPEDRREETVLLTVRALADFVKSAPGSFLWAWGGWVLAAITVVVCVPAVLLMSQRLKTQGKLLKRYKSGDDPGLGSSMSLEGLANHARETRSRAIEDDPEGGP